MSRLRYNWREARTHLQRCCPKLAAYIADFGAGRLQAHDGGDLFQALARSIAFQQLSGKAASTIHGRFEALFSDGRPNTGECIGFSEETLRGAGLSRAKARSILDLAGKQRSGILPNPRRLGAMSDDEIIDRLVQVRGIGPWTVQMHLIFYLGRPDVMPATDLGVQKGVRNVYGLEALPSPAETLERTAHLAPFRSAAAWYFWRASETVTL